MMIAMAIAVSAAAIAIANNAKKNPSNCPGYKKRLNITKFRSAALSINSIDIKTISMFLRDRKPYTPTKNIIVLTAKYASIGTEVASKRNSPIIIIFRSLTYCIAYFLIELIVFLQS